MIRFAKRGSFMNRYMLSSLVFVVALSVPAVSRAAVISAGTDTVPWSTAVFTVTINDPFFPGGFTELIDLSSGSFGIVRQLQQGDGDGGGDDFINTEIVSLSLTGMSTNVGPVTVRVGAGNGVQQGQTLGQITSVKSDPVGTFDPVGPGAFISGDSSFNVFYELDAAGMTFYNKVEHVLSVPGIEELPPLDVHLPPNPPVSLYMRVGAVNDPGDPLVGSAGGSHTTPEPSTFALVAVGLLSLGCVSWRRRRRS